MIYTAASAVSTNLSSRSSLRCIAASLSAPAASADDIVAAHKTPPLVKPKSRRQERGLVERFAPICRSCCRTRSYTACTLASATPSASTLEISVSDSPNPPATPSHRHSSDHFRQWSCAKSMFDGGKNAPIRRWKSWAVGPTWRTPSPCALYRQLRTGSASRPSRSAVRFSSAKSRFDLTSDSADLHPQNHSQLQANHPKTQKSSGPSDHNPPPPQGDLKRNFTEN